MAASILLRYFPYYLTVNRKIFVSCNIPETSDRLPGNFRMPILKFGRQTVTGFAYNFIWCSFCKSLFRIVKKIIVRSACNLVFGFSCNEFDIYKRQSHVVILPPDAGQLTPRNPQISLLHVPICPRQALYVFNLLDFFVAELNGITLPAVKRNRFKTGCNY